MGFLGFIGFWALLEFSDFYSNQQLGSMLVDLAHSLSFYLHSPVLCTLDYLTFCKFITYWLLEAVNIKKSVIISGMTN